MLVVLFDFGQKAGLSVSFSSVADVSFLFESLDLFLDDVHASLQIALVRALLYRDLKELFCKAPKSKLMMLESSWLPVYAREGAYPTCCPQKIA